MYKILKNKPLEDWIIDRLIKKQYVTTWHLNDDFIDFWEKFSNKTDIKKAQKKLRYYMNKFVKKDLAERSTMGLGAGGLWGFGTRTQTTYEPTEIFKITYKDRIEKINNSLNF